MNRTFSRGSSFTTYKFGQQIVSPGINSKLSNKALHSANPKVEGEPGKGPDNLTASNNLGESPFSRVPAHMNLNLPPSNASDQLSKQSKASGAKKEDSEEIPIFFKMLQSQVDREETKEEETRPVLPPTVNGTPIKAEEERSNSKLLSTSQKQRTRRKTLLVPRGGLLPKLQGGITTPNEAMKRIQRRNSSRRLFKDQETFSQFLNLPPEEPSMGRTPGSTLGIVQDQRMRFNQFESNPMNVFGQEIERPKKKSIDAQFSMKTPIESAIGNRRISHFKETINLDQISSSSNEALPKVRAAENSMESSVTAGLLNSNLLSQDVTPKGLNFLQSRDRMDSQTIDRYLKKQIIAENQKKHEEEQKKEEESNRIGSPIDKIRSLKQAVSNKIISFFRPMPVEIKKEDEGSEVKQPEMETPTKLVESPPQPNPNRRATILIQNKATPNFGLLSASEEKKKEEMIQQLRMKHDKLKQKLLLKKASSMISDDDEEEERDILKAAHPVSNPGAADDGDIYIKPKEGGLVFLNKVIIKRSSRLRWILKLAVLPMAIFSALLAPMVIAFSEDLQPSPQVYTYRIVACSVFTMDLLVKLLSSFIDERTGEEVLVPSKIIQRYLTSGEFLCDFLAALPFFLVWSDSWAEPFEVLIMVKLLSVRIPLWLSQRVHSKMLVKLAKLLFQLLLYTHFTTCLVYWLVKADRVWLPSQYDFYAIKDDFYSVPMIDRYAVTYYHAIMVLVGNEINPLDTFNILLVSMLYIMGALILANIFANVTVIISNMNVKEKQFEEKLNLVNTAMDNMQLPQGLRGDIHQFMMTTQNNLDNQKELDLFMQMISPSLRSRVTKHIFLKAIESNPILRGSQELINFLLNEVTTLLYMPEDKIVCQGQKGGSLFLIAKGDCTVWVNDHMRRETCVRQLNQGEFFGEISVLRQTMRTATVKSSNYCTLASLSKTIFFDLCGIFPEILIKMRNKSLEYNDTWKKFKLLLIKQIDYLRFEPRYEANALDEIQYSMVDEFLEPGAVLAKEGDRCENMFFVVTGRVEIVTQNKDGEEFVIEELRQGDIIGQYSILFSETLNFTARCKTEVRVLRLSQSFFIQNRDLIMGLEAAVFKAEDIVEAYGVPAFDYKLFIENKKNSWSQKLRAVVRRIQKLKQFTRLKGDTLLSQKVTELQIKKKYSSRLNLVVTTKEVSGSKEFRKKVQRKFSSNMNLKKFGNLPEKREPLIEDILQARQERRHSIFTTAPNMMPLFQGQMNGAFTPNMTLGGLPQQHLPNLSPMQSFNPKLIKGFSTPSQVHHQPMPTSPGLRQFPSPQQPLHQPSLHQPPHSKMSSQTHQSLIDQTQAHMPKFMPALDPQRIIRKQQKMIDKLSQQNTLLSARSHISTSSKRKKQSAKFVLIGDSLQGGSILDDSCERSSSLKIKKKPPEVSRKSSQNLKNPSTFLNNYSIRPAIELDPASDGSSSSDESLAPRIDFAPSLSIKGANFKGNLEILSEKSEISENSSIAPKSRRTGQNNAVLLSVSNPSQLDYLTPTLKRLRTGRLESVEDDEITPLERKSVSNHIYSVAKKKEEGKSVVDHFHYTNSRIFGQQQSHRGSSMKGNRTTSTANRARDVDQQNRLKGSSSLLSSSLDSDSANSFSVSMGMTPPIRGSNAAPQYSKFYGRP